MNADDLATTTELISAPLSTPNVIHTASAFLATLYHCGYTRLGKKRRKKKSAPKRVATKTQKTMVSTSAVLRSILCRWGRVGPEARAEALTWVWRSSYFEREYVAVHSAARQINIAS